MSKKILIVSLGLIVLTACSRGKSEFVMAAGVVDGEVITVKAAVSGKIESLNILEGREVDKNSILVTVDSDKIENQIQGLEIQKQGITLDRKKRDRRIQLLNANLEYWKKQVESFERLEKKESIAGDQLEQARLKMDEVEASLFDAQQSLRELSVQLKNIKNQREYLNLLLEDHIIVSPVSGVVLEKFVSQGETVFPGTPVADILDWSSLYVETFLEETELSRLELGQKIDVLVDGMEGRVFSGTIIYFGKEAEFSPKYIISEKERQSLLYRVKIKLEQDLKVFKLGMPVTVRINRRSFMRTENA
jgi:HlyD family secretion protein